MEAYLDEIQDVYPKSPIKILEDLHWKTGWQHHFPTGRTCTLLHFKPQQFNTKGIVCSRSLIKLQVSDVCSCAVPLWGMFGAFRSRAGACPGRSWAISPSWRGGSAWPAAAGALPVARAAGTALPGNEGLFCCACDQSSSLQQPLHSHTSPLGSPRRDRPGFTSSCVRKVWWRSKGVAVTYLHTIGRNFLLAEFSISLHLGENLADIWTHWNHLVLSCLSVSTWKRSICWKISAFGASCSLRWRVVETSDTESQGAWKGCFLDWHPKLRCWRRLGRALGWGEGRTGLFSLQPEK